MHAYLAQHCFFLPLPHMLVGIQNATATSKKQKTPACIREIQVHKLWTKVYSKKGLTTMKNQPRDQPEGHGSRVRKVFFINTKPDMSLLSQMEKVLFFETLSHSGMHFIYTCEVIHQ